MEYTNKHIQVCLVSKLTVSVSLQIESGKISHTLMKNKCVTPRLFNDNPKLLRVVWLSD